MTQDASGIENKKTAFSLMTFYRETKREISKVTWPSRKETMTTTIMVVVMALMAGIFFFGVDAVLGYVITHILSMNS